MSKPRRKLDKGARIMARKMRGKRSNKHFRQTALALDYECEQVREKNRRGIPDPTASTPSPQPLFQPQPVDDISTGAGIIVIVAFIVAFIGIMTFIAYLIP